MTQNDRPMPSLRAHASGSPVGADAAAAAAEPAITEGAATPDPARTLVLLDVDGVLNPFVSRHPDTGRTVLFLDPQRTELVQELAAIGTIVWATTWPARALVPLADTLGLPASTEAVSFDFSLSGDARTPKLPLIVRWLERKRDALEAPWTRIVWIDDNLAQDAFDWAAGYSTPVLAIRPESFEGLVREEVEEARAFATR